MAASTGDAAGASDTYFDAEECAEPRRRAPALVPLCRARRATSDFPETERSTNVGPWRATEVERRPAGAAGAAGGSGAEASEAWLLVGRRHSVDERRDAMEQGKALFLRALAERADGAWRARTAGRAEELQASEDRVQAQLSQQTHALHASRDFWAERHASDQAYLERLQACAASSVAMPAGQAKLEAGWREGIRQAAGRSAGWARRLPELVGKHEQAASEIRRAVARAVTESGEASKFVRAARAEVWPATGAVAAITPGTHSADLGPEGICLWHTVRRYLAACDALQSSQAIALARVRREERRAERLGEWVDRQLGQEGASSTSPSPSPASSPPSPVSSPPSPASLLPRPGASGPAGPGGAAGEAAEAEEEDDEEDTEGGGSSDDGGEADDLAATDLSALVVHEQEVELFRDTVVDDEGGSGAGGAAARILLSVDLWLHIWSGDMSTTRAPVDSIPLARACLRPVAVRSTEDPRVLRFLFRPLPPPGLLASLTAFLWREQNTRPQVLLMRCEDAAACDELLAVLELVEKLYPLV